MNILFTICGRAGSKGCKSKNIKQFLGHPLFEYTINAINEYKKLNENSVDTCVSTDSLDFIRLLDNHEDIFVINRDINLAGDTIPKMAVIKDALIKSEVHYNKEYSIILDLDITSPIRTVQDIKNAIDRQIETQATCVFSVTKARRNPYFNMVKEDNGVVSKVLESDYTARQQAPKMYDMNASIYAYSRDFLLSDSTSPINGKPQIIEMLDTGIIDIDDDEDFELMEVIAKFMTEKNEYNKIFQIKTK